MKLNFIWTLLFFSSTASAFNEDIESFTHEVLWADLLDTVIANGNQTDTPMGAIFGLNKKTVIDVDQKWSTNFVTIAGKHSRKDGFIINHITFSQENWEISANGESWYIYQHTYYMNPKGEFKYASYRKMEKFKDSRIVITELDEGTPEEQYTSWLKQKKIWLKY